MEFKRGRGLDETTVHDIVKEYLEDNGFEGLRNDDCGCYVNNLAPNYCVFSSCTPVKKHGDDYFIYKCKK